MSQGVHDSFQALNWQKQERVGGDHGENPEEWLCLVFSYLPSVEVTVVFSWNKDELVTFDELILNLSYFVMLPMNFKEHQLFTEKGRMLHVGPNWQDVILRVQASIRHVLQQQGPGQGILLVCHSWVNKALIASVTPGLGLKRLLDVPQRNCAVNVLDYCHGAGHFKLLAVDLVAGTRAARF